MNISFKPVSKWAVFAAVIAAALFWLSALRNKSGFLLLDHVNLPFHEFGHIFFSPFGEFTGILGGTIMQLAIPFGIMILFVLKGETAGAAFCAFWLGENLLNISVYMADARRMILPLVGGGEHDWNILFYKVHLLRYDTVIAKIVRFVGWLIMILSLVWFVIMGLRKKEEEEGY